MGSELSQISNVMDEQKRILKQKESECNDFTTISPTNGSGTCKPTWDQILCWPETQPGEFQNLPCPGYFFGFDPKQNATRFCHENGTWNQWSNYSECYDSLYATVTEPFTGAINDSTLAGTIWDCKLVSSIWQYFMLANYSWILMEALYLHNLIFSALFSDRSSIKVYVILGWGLPLLCVIPWIVCRIYIEDDLCWTVNRNKFVFGIIFVPIAVSNIICFILFVILVWVILRKLRSSVCEETKIYRRLAKSTLVLIPLFGVHYVVFLGFHWYSDTESTTEMIALFINQLFTSFQGFFVALLYCFLNAEVRIELGKSCSWWSRRRGGSSGGGVMNGVLGGCRLSAGNHRTSCYSRTSCTSLSLAPNNNVTAVVARGKEKDLGRPRAGAGAAPRGSLHNTFPAAEGTSPFFQHAARGCHRTVADVKSPLWQEHRQSKSNFSTGVTEIEMKPITH